MSVALDLSTRRKTDRPDEWEGLVDPEPLDVELPRAVEPLTEEEKYLAVLLQDHSGLDQAEFCIGGGQLVITGDGWIPIQDVRVGQLVLTHKNRWRPVSAVYDRGVREVVTVRGQGHPGLVVTPDHQLLVRRARRGTERGDGHRNSVLEPAEWRAPQDFKDLTYRGGKYRSWWWGSPSKAEPLPITPFPEVGKLRVAFGPWEPDWLWLFGHWLSEGNVSDNRAGYSITWSVNPRVLHEVTDRLDNLNLRHSVTNGNNCSDNIDRVAVYSQQLASWLAAEGGRRSSNKRLPAWVLGLPTEGREALFDGLSAGDGTPTPTGGSCYSSTSRQLAFGVRSLATSLGRSASMTHYGEYTSSFGTPGLPYWKVTSETGLGKTFTGEGHAWTAVKEITDFGSQSVWDISVEEDHSFVVEGITVHNCWKDPNKSDNCYRAQPSQWAWWRERESRTMDASARSVGKCLGGDTRITLADGRRVAISTLVGQTPEIMAWDDASGTVRPAPTVAIYRSGEKPTVLLRTRLGRELVASSDHRVLTAAGWRTVGDLVVGDRVASPAAVRPSGALQIPEHEIRFLALAICDAKLTQPTINYCKGDPELVDDFCDAVERFDNIKAVVKWWGEKHAWEVLPTRINQKGRPRNKALECVERHGLHGKRSPEKEIPEAVFRLTPDGLALFLGRLLSGDGCVERRAFTYSSASKALVEQVRHLLLRFGVISTMRHRRTSAVKGGPKFDSWELRVPPVAMQALNQSIGQHVIGAKRAALASAVAGGVRRSPLTSQHDRDIIWDAVVAIEPAGDQETFDITMAGDPNFLADDIVVHNSESVMADACQFPFNFPDQEFLITAPEGQHVESLTDRIEARINSTRLLREMLVRNRSGIKHKPFVATFQNGARVYARLPQRSGIGLKGTHPVILHVDEAQDMSEQAWREMPEIVRNDVPGNKWKIHGVSKGIQGDSFDKYSRPDSGFKVFNITGLHREGWSKEERADKVKQYGGSDRSPDFLRNVYGMPGASSNRIFVLTRLMAGCDVMEASDYNTNEYYKTHISADHVIGRLADKGVSELDASTEEMADVLAQMIQPPTMHTSMHSVFWMGADIGVVSDPTEIVVWAEYVPDKAERQRDRRANVAVPDAGMTRFKLVTRVRLEQIPLPLQARVVMHLINIYKPRAFTLDRTGVGHGLLQNIQQLAGSARFVIAEEADDPRNAAAASAAGDALTVIKGYNFSEKVVIGIDEKMVDDLHLSDPGDILEKASIRQHAKDASTDVLRDLVDTRRLKIPYDHEVIDQMNGQTWTSSREPVDKYGRRRSVWSIGTFHILDGCRMFALGWAQQPIEAMFAEARKPSGPVIARFGL